MAEERNRSEDRDRSDMPGRERDMPGGMDDERMRGGGTDDVRGIADDEEEFEDTEDLEDEEDEDNASF